MKAPAFLVSSTERRVALFYFTTMMPLGAAVVQAGVWFAENGISSGGIGVINAVPVLIMIGLNLTLGRIADRASDWRQAIVVAAAFQSAVTLGLFFVDGFWGILAVWTLSVVPNLSIGPVLDAASMRMTRRNGTSFGPLRACATVGYLLMVGLTGVLVTRFGGAIFVPFYVGLTLLKAFAAQLLPTFRAPPGTADPSGDRGASHLSEVMQGWFVLPLFGYAMVFGTHIILNAFAALLWRSQGIPAATVGQLIMLGAIAEAGMMFAWGRVRGRITPEAGLLLGGIGRDVPLDRDGAGATGPGRWSACNSCTRSPLLWATCRWCSSSPPTPGIASPRKHRASTSCFNRSCRSPRFWLSAISVSRWGSTPISLRPDSRFWGPRSSSASG